MQYLRTIASLYFEQEDAFAPIFILLIALVTFAVCLHLYEKFAKHDLEQFVSTVILSLAVGVMSTLMIVAGMSDLVYPTDIMTNSTYEEIDKYYILHFNPDNEAFIYDENGAVRVNGNERMIEISESQLDKVNYIEVKANKLTLDEELMNRLHRKSDVYIHNYRVVDKKYEVK